MYSFLVVSSSFPYYIMRKRGGNRWSYTISLSYQVTLQPAISSSPYSKMRKRGGNNCTFLVVLYN